MNEQLTTIDDIANALGVSKSTVSRAISGKGRVGEKTRQEILKFCEEHNYRPNAAAKSLASNRTFNLALVMPEDFSSSDRAFFQEVMVGASAYATKYDYDMIISINSDMDASPLKRMILNQKVDGVLISRSIKKSAAVSLLKKSELPFVIIGSSSDSKTVCVDNDNEAAVKELVFGLIKENNKKIALLGGDENYLVTGARLNGYKDALNANGIKYNEKLVFMNCTSGKSITKAVKKALDQGADCIVCMDDYICSIVVTELRRIGKSIPGDVKLASCYDSPTIANTMPPITGIKFDTRKLGEKAAKTILSMLDIDTGNDSGYHNKELVGNDSDLTIGYEIVKRASTMCD